MNNPPPGQGQNAGQKKTTGTGRTEAEEQSAKSAHPGEKKDAIDLLKADHREVDQLFEEFKSAQGSQRKKLIDKIGAALIAHTMIEEEIFYPACRDKGVEHDELNEAQVEHDTIKMLVADLLKSSRNDEYYEAKATVLGEYVKHHVGEEEDPSDGIFARARKAGLDMDELGQRLQTRKDELVVDEKRLLSRPPQIRSLEFFQQNQEYGDMSRYPNDRYRDEDLYRGEPGRQGENRSFGGYRGNIDDDYRASRGGRDQAYRGGDDDYGPNRDSYGRPDYDRSSHGYRDDDRQPRRDIEVSGSGGRYRTNYDDDRSRQGGGRHLESNHGDREYFQGTRYGSSYGGGRYRTEDDNDEGDTPPGQNDRYYSGQGYGPTRGADLGGRNAYGNGDDYRSGNRDRGTTRDAAGTTISAAAAASAAFADR